MIRRFPYHIKTGFFKNEKNTHTQKRLSLHLKVQRMDGGDTWGSGNAGFKGQGGYFGRVANQLVFHWHDRASPLLTICQTRFFFLIMENIGERLIFNSSFWVVSLMIGATQNTSGEVGGPFWSEQLCSWRNWVGGLLKVFVPDLFFSC